MRAPIGGVKNDLITSAVVLSFSCSGMFANAVPASQKEQTRRYKEMNAYTLVTDFSLLPLEVNDSNIPERCNVGSTFSFWSIAESQNKLQIVAIKRVVSSSFEKPLAYLQTQETQVNSFQCKVYPVGLHSSYR